MGKSSRAKRRHPATASQWQVLYVDACEVGARSGLLTIRAGHVSKDPACFALHVGADFADQLHDVSLDAEELYWQTMPCAKAGAAHGDAPGTHTAIEAWLLKQDWDGLLRRIPADYEMFQLSSWGYVAFGARPPFSRAPLLAIFDPLQLRRLGPGFRSALAAARSGPPPAGPHVAAEVLAELETAPWPPSGTGYQEPAAAEAAEWMTHRYRAYLARDPYIRPAERNLRT